MYRHYQKNVQDFVIHQKNYILKMFLRYRFQFIAGYANDGSHLKERESTGQQHKRTHISNQNILFSTTNFEYEPETL